MHLHHAWIPWLSVCSMENQCYVAFKVMPLIKTHDNKLRGQEEAAVCDD